MTYLPLAITAGEHSKEIAPASIVTVPRVTKVNAMNQAQTVFYRKVDKEWVVLSERPMQFTNTLRNIFLIYLMPNVAEPQIRTLIDTATGQ
jgi:L-lysine 2,3-aminomutase